MTTPTATDQLLAGLVEQFSRIADALERLAPLADYATLLHTEKTGEQVYEVQRYVVGSDSEGNPCAWLYATHPGLKFAVTRVYHDHLHKLPYPLAANAKVWDGEVAPSAEAAAKKGYFNAFPAAFSISLMPTGKKTDKDEPIRRLHRILDAPKPAPPNNGQRPLVPAPQRPASEEPPAWAAPDPATEAEFEFENMPQAAKQPAQARALAQAAASPTVPAAADQPAEELPFKDQGTAVKWATSFAHYQKDDGSPDYAHAVGSLATLCKELGCSDKNLECWGQAWLKHVQERAGGQ